MSSSVGSVLVAIDRREERSLQSQITDALRTAIVNGTLRPGTRLPGTRTLATQLGVSRTTVTLALEALIAERFAEARARSGTFVVATSPRAPTFERGPVMRGAGPRLARRASALVRQRARAPGRRGEFPGAVPFALARPALDEFPISLWNRLLARRAARTTIAQLDYGAEVPALCAAIAAQVSSARGLRVSADQILLVGGAQRAIELAAAAFVDPGDRVAVEDPGYPGARNAFVAAGASIVGIPVDDEGVDLEHVERARMAYVTPSCQFPLGVTTSLARRRMLLAWADRHDACIVEDDYDHDFRFEGAPLPALAALDRRGRVLYCGSFSRTMFPGIRIGYLIAPVALVDPLRAIRAAREEPLAALTQLALADFIEGGHYAHHVRRMNVIYRARRDVLLDAARTAGLTIRPSAAGLHVICDLPRGTDARAVAVAVKARGVEVATLASFHVRARRSNSLVLGFGVVPPSRIRTAMTTLAAVIRRAP